MNNKIQWLEQKALELNHSLFSTINELTDELKLANTELISANQELNEANMRLNLVLEGVDVGIWDWIDLKKDDAFLNDRFYEILGYSPGEFPAKVSCIIDWMHPHDKEKILQQLDNHLKNDESYNVECRIKVKDGMYRWFNASGKCLRDETGKPFRMAGSIRDIHKRKEAEIHISQLNNELEASNEEMLTQNEELISMNEELSTLNEEINMINQNLENIIGERTKELENKNEELKNAVRQLEKRNFELDNLVYKISHDIRSPLTTILGILSIAKNEKENVVEYLQLAINQVNKLDYFVRSMLSFAKANRVESTVEKIDFNELINKCFEDLEYHPKFNQLERNINIKEDPDVEFYNDPLRLYVILSNVISNSVKYQNSLQKDNHLDIEVHVAEDKANIRIKDNGIGIDKKYLPKVYDMFFRASEKSQGSGLGLYIVKQTVEKLEGDVEIDSQLGEFTELKIKIPNKASSLN